MAEAQPLSTSDDWPENAIPRKWIETLFDKMWMTYGARFADQWRTEDVQAAEDLKRYWAISLRKFTKQELSDGLAALSGRDWPPTLPEFEKMCRPPIDPLAAFYEAVNGIQAREKGEFGRWSSPAIYWAAVRIGAFELKNSTYVQIRARWEIELKAAIKHDSNSIIPEPMLQIAAVGKGVMSNEAAAKMISQVKSSEMFNPANAATDEKRWARKLLERIRCGDKSLSLIQYEYVEEVLGTRE